jgi:hypothetical protein
LSAEVNFPASSELRANGTVIWSGGRVAAKLPPGITHVADSGSTLSVEIDSGTWSFLTATVTKPAK